MPDIAKTKRQAAFFASFLVTETVEKMPSENTGALVLVWQFLSMKTRLMRSPQDEPIAKEFSSFHIKILSVERLARMNCSGTFRTFFAFFFSYETTDGIPVTYHSSMLIKNF